MHRTQILFILLIAVMAVSSCSSVQSEAKAEPAANVAPTRPEDADIANALVAVERVPDSPLGYIQLAVAYIKRARQSGDFSLNAKAETAVKKALELAPDDIPAKKLQATLDLTFHRFDSALANGQELEKLLPSDPFVFGVLTDANVELGNYEAAIAAAQKMVDLKPNSTSYARVAHLRSLHGDMAGAVEMYTTSARTADPTDREAQSYSLVKIGEEYLKYGKFVEAERVFAEALANLPNYHLALAGKGRARAGQNDLDGAITILTDANNRVPNVETAILLGDIYTKKGDTAKADEQYALVEAIEQSFGVNNDQKRLALLWADRGVKLDEALAIGVKESRMRRDIFTSDALAWAYYKRGEYGPAKDVINDAMRLKSNDAKILYHAGMIEAALGNKGKAIEFLEKALKTNPSFDLIQSDVAKAKLAELRGTSR